MENGKLDNGKSPIHFSNGKLKVESGKLENGKLENGKWKMGNPLFTIHYSLEIIHYSLKMIHFSLFTAVGVEIPTNHLINFITIC